MPEAYETGSAFVIQERTGEERLVRLTDRALPYRPFELTTKQRVELTWYPGNPIATATVLGSQEDGTTIQGYWKDKYIGRGYKEDGESLLFPIEVNGLSVDNVREASFVMDGIVRQGQEIEVTWDEQTRRGYLVEFRKKWHNVHDLEWEMRFDWVSRGEAVSPSVVAESTSPADTAGTIEEKNTKLQVSANFIFPVGTATQNALIDHLVGIDVAVAAVLDTNESLSRLSISISDAQRRMVSAFNTIMAEAEALIATLEAAPLFAVNEAASISALTYGQRMLGYRYSRTLIDECNDLWRFSVETRQALLAQLTDQVLGIYTAREGDDLRKVSQRFYGTPFEWRRLMLFNSLTSSELTAGAVILVPEISAGDPA